LRKWEFRFNRTFRQLRRYRHIMGVLMKYGFGEVADTFGRRFNLGKQIPLRIKPAAGERSRPERVRLALEEMGPTFVKVGQLLSTRPDLVPARYITELEKLQDQVAPEDPELIKAEIEKELGGRIGDIFEHFDTVPIAAGSIAQVHKAVTKSGDTIVLKVRRPNIVQTIEAECRILEDIAGLLKTMFLEDDTVDPQRMMREFGDAVSKEADLSLERLNQLHFCRSFAGDPTVHIPQVYEEYCTQGVLAMEYIDGIRPSKMDKVIEAGLDPKIVAARGANFVLKQVFEFGFFHTDPHPGNFFLLENNVLAPLDFGQVARLSSDDRTLLYEMVLSVVDNDCSRILQALERAEMIKEDTDMNRLGREAEALLDTYQGMPLKEIPLGRVITRIFDLIRKHHVRPPAQFTLMLKSLMTIETFALSLDKDFKIVDHLKPYARRFKMRQLDPTLILRNTHRALQDAQELAMHLPDDARSIINKFRRGQFQMRIHHEHLENLVNTLDKSSNRISFSLIIAALLVASSMVISQEEITLGMINLHTLGVLGYLAAAVLGIWLAISIIRGRRF